jgi:hypothetical protein
MTIKKHERDMTVIKCGHMIDELVFLVSVSDRDTPLPEVGLADEDIDEHAVPVPAEFDGLLQDFPDFILIAAVKLQPHSTVTNGNLLIISKLKIIKVFPSVPFFLWWVPVHCLATDLLGLCHKTYKPHNYFMIMMIRILIALVPLASVCKTQC